MSTGYIFKARANEANLSSSNSSFSNASLVRIANPSAAAAVVVFAANGVQYANATVLASSEVLLQKAPTDTLASACTALVGLSIAIRDQMMLIELNGYILDCVVASRPDEWEVGLSHRTELPWDCGMLFDFHKEEVRSMWMKDTFIELDMIFIDEGLNIVYVETYCPIDCDDLISSQQPCRYVLEVNAGLVDELLVSVGDQIKIIDRELTEEEDYENHLNWLGVNLREQADAINAVGASSSVQGTGAVATVDPIIDRPRMKVRKSKGPTRAAQFIMNYIQNKRRAHFSSPTNAAPFSDEG